MKSFVFLFLFSLLAGSAWTQCVNGTDSFTVITSDNPLDVWTWTVANGVVEEAEGGRNAQDDAYDDIFGWILSEEAGDISVGNAGRVCLSDNEWATSEDVTFNGTTLSVQTFTLIPADQNWARATILVTNSGPIAVPLTIQTQNNLGSDGDTRIVASSPSDFVDATINETVDWFLTEQIGGGDPFTGWVISQELRPTAITPTGSGEDDVDILYEFPSLAVGDSVSLTFYSSVNPDAPVGTASIMALFANATTNLLLGNLPPEALNPANLVVVCGNGLIQTGEQCDDGNTIDGDGCSSTCQVEDGFVCTGEPSLCEMNEDSSLSSSLSSSSSSSVLGASFFLIVVSFFAF